MDITEHGGLKRRREHIREALEIYRRLADKEPQVYEPYVAMTLNNLGNVLDNLRRFEEAEGAYREALGIYRRLADRRCPRCMSRMWQ
jgi:nephrocystin-3